MILVYNIKCPLRQKLEDWKLLSRLNVIWSSRQGWGWCKHTCHKFDLLVHSHSPTYSNSMKYWPILYIKLLHNLGQDFLDRQYVTKCIRSGHHIESPPPKKSIWYPLKESVTQERTKIAKDYRDICLRLLTYWYWQIIFSNYCYYICKSLTEDL